MQNKLLIRWGKEGALINYNSATRELAIQGMGRNPVFIRRADGTIQSYYSLLGDDHGGPHLNWAFSGFDESMVGKIKLNEGDQVMIMSDGVTESVIQGEGGSLSREKFLEYINKFPKDLSPQELNQEIIRGLKPPLTDDTTMISFDA